MADHKTEVSVDMWGIFFTVLLVLLTFGSCGEYELYIKNSGDTTTVGLHDKEEGEHP